MEAATRRAVRSRAEDRCEYCLRAQDKAPLFRFHIEHVIARQQGGGDELDNLALACHSCNLHQGPNLTGIDPETGRVARLFHPRKDRWKDHFRLDRDWIVGLTPEGRTTVRLLVMNSEGQRELRAQE